MASVGVRSASLPSSNLVTRVTHDPSNYGHESEPKLGEGTLLEHPPSKAEASRSLNEQIGDLRQRLPLGEVAYIDDHVIRFNETLDRFFDSFAAAQGQKVLCLGGKSHFESWLSDYFAFEMTVYSADLRLPLDLDSDQYALVLMLEVIEHLYDVPQEAAFADEFSFSGMNACLGEVARVLRPDGELCLTTPNFVSADAIGQACLGLSPMQYTPHVRELTPRDLRGLCSAASLKVVELTTAFVWNPVAGVDREVILRMLSENRFNTEDRGDDMFLVCRLDEA